MFFNNVGELSRIQQKQIESIVTDITSHQNKVQTLIFEPYLDEKTKRNYWQAYQTRLRKLDRDL